MSILQRKSLEELKAELAKEKNLLEIEEAKSEEEIERELIIEQIKKTKSERNKKMSKKINRIKSDVTKVGKGLKKVGKGIGGMMDTVIDVLPEPPKDNKEKDDIFGIGDIGKPSKGNKNDDPFGVRF